MIKPKKNYFVFRFFSWYISWIIKRNFKNLNFNEVAFDKSQSVLLIANHFSWWDGFLYFHLNKIYFKKNFYVMVKEETAKKVKFLKYLGAFSVLKNSKSLVDSLNYATHLLNNQNNLVLIFPQGNLQSSHTNKIIFQKGIYKIIKTIKGNWQCIFAVALTDYFESPKASIEINLSKAFLGDDEDIANLYQLFYNQCKTIQSAKSV